MNNLHGLKLIDYAGMKMIVDMGDPVFTQDGEAMKVDADFSILAVVMNDLQYAAASDELVAEFEGRGIRVMSASEYAMKGYTDGRS